MALSNEPYEKNGISYCFSTYKNDWVSCPIKDLPKIGAGMHQSYKKKQVQDRTKKRL